MFSTFMLIIECFFFLFSSVNSQRYYAFVETLFVIDQNYFPSLSAMSYEEYVKTMVDTANIIFQSQNDLDIKIEMIVSKILFLNVMLGTSQEPHTYEPILRGKIEDYDRYDSIVLLSYQPWEGENGAQGYAMVQGVCNPKNKIMYILPYQNAAFYLAHEFGHQLGLQHQVKTSCYTTSYMSVLTLAHTASYERARWTSCENDWINSHICEFHCLFNKPDGYQVIKNKYSTMPGQHMSNDQQAKTIQPNAQAMGEISSYTYAPSESPSRCLYFRSNTGQANGYITGFTPMLPGSTCGDNSVCHMDKCVPKSELDSSILIPQIETNILELSKQCSAGGDPNEFKSSNHDPRQGVQCVDWESDFLCETSRTCPKDDDASAGALYVQHICCAKCSSKPATVLAAFNRARRNSNMTTTKTFFLLFLCLSVILNN